MNSTKPKASVITRFKSDNIVITASVEGTNISKQITIGNAYIECELPLFVKSVFGTQFHEVPKEHSEIFDSFDKCVSYYLSNILENTEEMVLAKKLSDEGFHVC